MQQPFERFPRSIFVRKILPAYQGFSTALVASTGMTTFGELAILFGIREIVNIVPKASLEYTEKVFLPGLSSLKRE